MVEKVLAKFNPEETLEEHTENAISVYSSIKKNFIWIPHKTGTSNFWEHLFYAVLLHDVGKSAIGFQKDPRIWGYRHEILSTPFVQFLNFPEDIKNSVGISILTHHKYLSEIKEKIPPPIKLPVQTEYEIKVDELLKNSEYIEETFFNKIKELEHVHAKQCNLKLPSNWDKEIANYDFTSLIDWYEDNVRSRRQYLTTLKGLLNAIDHLSSAGQRHILNLPNIYNSIATQMEELRPLQKVALNTNNNVVLRAPTGYGKTEASLFWAHANMANSNSNRIFYILPYKASINAMHERLKQKYFREKGMVGILHSSSEYYLYASGEDFKKLNNLYKKIYSPIKVLTPFQVMKAIFGVGFYEMSFAELTNSLLIFDEIHAYEENTVGIILGMLKIFTEYYGTKTLIMSATLPSFLEEYFLELLDPKKLTLKDEQLDTFTRHSIQILDKDIFSELDKLDSFIEKFGKPLLVACNTVDRAIEVYKFLNNRYRALLIHGRFCYGDRENLEQKLKNNFYEYDVVVATQVVEVSLDLNFSTIITEPAPLDALIQRFGRVNRQGWKNNLIKPVHILKEGSKRDRYVYDGELVKRSLKVLEELNEDLLKESKVKTLMDNVYLNYARKHFKEIEEARVTTEDMYESLKPLSKNEDEFQFYELFKGFEVIPVEFEKEIDDLALNGDYIEIHRYKVPLSVSKFLTIKSKFGDVFSFKKINRTKISIVYADLKYDKELGLITDEVNDNKCIL